jgi:hypothetical protein
MKNFVSDRRFNLASFLASCLIGLTILLTGCDLPQVSAEERTFLDLSLEFLNAYELPKQTFQDTPVGGLSALTYDRKRNLLYAVSDDLSEFAPARFYTLNLSLDTANSTAPTIKQVEVNGVTFITDELGKPYAKGEVDPEGIALSPLGTLFISSEGIASKGIAPFVREFDLKTGQWKRSLSIPDRYFPKTENGQQTQGVGENLGFESLTLNLNGGSTGNIEPFRLFTATESALVQDASPEHPQQGASRNRVLHYSLDPTHALRLSEHLYEMELPPDGARFHGLTEMLAIDQGGHFLGIERSFGSNGFAVKLFQLALGSASDTSTIESFQGSVSGVQPIRKKLLLDLNQLGVPLDNLEGITLGPRLPDGSQSLLLVSDNNFSDQQKTLFFLFRIKGIL